MKLIEPRRGNKVMKSFRIATSIFWIVITIIPIVGIILGLLDPQSFESAKATWQNRIAAFGIWGPFALVVIQILQVIITPISHYSVGVIGGFLYGPYLGGFLNWLGRVIGHSIAFILGRKIGRTVAERFVQESTLQKYDQYVSDKSLPLFIFFFLPLFPDDELSYLAGLSKMEFRLFSLANIFGQIGGSFGLAYVGSGISTKDPLFWVLSIATFVCFVALWWIQRKRHA